MIAALVLASLSANAQGMFIKPMAGGTLTTMVGDVENLKMKVGFVGGVELGYQFQNTFAITAGALYSFQGAKFKNDFVEINNNLQYLNVPVLLNVYVAPGLALKAGGQMGFLMRAKAGDEDIKHFFEKTDFAIPVGLSYEVEDAVVDLRYNIGVSKANKSEAYGLKADGSCRNSVIMLTIGYKIPMW